MINNVFKYKTMTVFVTKHLEINIKTSYEAHYQLSGRASGSR